jgi:hypothetical protein
MSVTIVNPDADTHGKPHVHTTNGHIKEHTLEFVRRAAFMTPYLSKPRPINPLSPLLHPTWESLQ